LANSQIEKFMSTIIVLFNLKPDANISDYEAWAKAKDIPTVKSLGSVSDFRVLKTSGLLGSGAAAPYQYCELIEVENMEAFFADLGKEDVQAGAKAFNEFADNPQFIVSNSI
jgi:REDY-like protein HapK